MEILTIGPKTQHGEKRDTKLTQSSSHNAHCVHVTGDRGDTHTDMGPIPWSL